MHQDMQIKVIYLSRQIVQLKLSLATKVIKLQFIWMIFYSKRKKIYIYMKERLGKKMVLFHITRSNCIKN